MPSLLGIIVDSGIVILESNSVIGFLRPDLYLSVPDYKTADFKASARKFLERADAIVLHQPEGPVQWSDVSLKALSGKPIFRITPPEYVTGELVAWVRQKIS